MKTKTVAITNQKGGVGKTTTTVNLGAALADMGKNVLLVDMDPQGNLSVCCNAMPHEIENTIHEVLKGEADINDTIITVERGNDNLKVLPADIKLSAAEADIATKPGREYVLKEKLGQLKGNFDYILIDCPPSLGILTLNALTASDKYIIPLASEFLALYGTSQLLQVVGIVRDRIKPELDLLGVLITQHDGRKVHSREIYDQIKEHFGNKVYDTVIRANITLTEAPSFRQDIFTYKNASPGAEDYKALAEEFIKGA